MPIQIWAWLAALVISACSPSKPKPAPTPGRVVIALTIDWEGAYLSVDGLDALDALRKRLGAAPLTHFVSAAYFTKDEPDPLAASSIAESIQPGDELALHLHAWRSLARASGIEPKLSPSYLTGTDKLLEFEDGDIGFDTDPDAYSVPDLRVLVRTSRRLLEQIKIPISRSFRAGGYLGTPKVLQAIRDEGVAVDSSAADHRQLDERAHEVLPRRIEEIWPEVDTSAQPWFVELSGGDLLELPIAAVADYATTAEIVGVVEAAHARLRASRQRDVFVVLAFHQETAGDFGGRLGDAIEQLRARPELAEDLLFTTVEHAATLARTALAGSRP